MKNVFIFIFIILFCAIGYSQVSVNSKTQFTGKLLPPRDPQGNFMHPMLIMNSDSSWSIWDGSGTGGSGGGGDASASNQLSQIVILDTAIARISLALQELSKKPNANITGFATSIKQDTIINWFNNVLTELSKKPNSNITGFSTSANQILGNGQITLYSNQYMSRGTGDSLKTALGRLSTLNSLTTLYTDKYLDKNWGDSSKILLISIKNDLDSLLSYSRAEAILTVNGDTVGSGNNSYAHSVNCLVAFPQGYSFTITADDTIEVSSTSAFTTGTVFPLRPNATSTVWSYTSPYLKATSFSFIYYRRKGTSGIPLIDVIAWGK